MKKHLREHTQWKQKVKHKRENIVALFVFSCSELFKCRHQQLCNISLLLKLKEYSLYVKQLLMVPFFYVWLIFKMQHNDCGRASKQCQCARPSFGYSTPSPCTKMKLKYPRYRFHIIGARVSAVSTSHSNGCPTQSQVRVCCQSWHYTPIFSIKKLFKTKLVRKINT